MQAAAHNPKITWQQQRRQQQQQQQRGSTQQNQQQGDCPCSDLVDWALQRLLKLELLEMQPADTELVMQLLDYAKQSLLDTLSSQQQQQTPAVLLQQVTQMLAGFSALQQGMAYHLGAVRSRARFAQHEQQQLQEVRDRFTLDWDDCLGKEHSALGFNIMLPTKPYHCFDRPPAAVYNSTS
jgi:hypothetical protein